MTDTLMPTEVRYVSAIPAKPSAVALRAAEILQQGRKDLLPNAHAALVKARLELHSSQDVADIALRTLHDIIDGQPVLVWSAHHSIEEGIGALMLVHAKLKGRGI